MPEAPLWGTLHYKESVSDDPALQLAILKLCSARAQVAAHLWHLVSVKAQLVQHLHALKAYFLLARGDFFQGFLSEVSGFFRAQLPQSSTLDECHLAQLQRGSKLTT